MAIPQELKIPRRCSATQGNHKSMTLSSFFLCLPLLVVAVESIPIYTPGSYKLSSSKKQVNPKIPYKTQYFPQNLDHFTFKPESYKVFYQKYLINSHFWNKNGSAPIFVYTGNEGDIEWFAANTGFLLDIAPKFQALLVFIEHRFYGESLPFNGKDLKTAKTLGYLTSQQTLADYAVLIRSLKKNLSSEASPVVVFGGSYGGMLAAWFRLKYPHVAIGALASSSPILQFDDIVPWTGFCDAVSKDFKDSSLNCYHVIKSAWNEIAALGNEKKGGLAKLSKVFRACKEISFVQSATNWLWTAFVYTAMMNYPTESNFRMLLPAYPVHEMCKIIDKSPREATNLSKTFAAASLYYNYSKTEKCFKLEGVEDPHVHEGWHWQACTEMVMPITCSQESMFPPFSFNYKEHGNSCIKKFGVRPREHWITTEFGGKRIKQVLKRFGSNIIFSNGMQDPWSRGGVLNNISSSIVALVTEKGAHHADLRGATKGDPNWLVEQRRQEVEIIQNWLHQYYVDNQQK